MNDQIKNEDEIYCPDCKKPISEQDTICPHCRVNLDEPIELDVPSQETATLKRSVGLKIILGLWFISNSILGLYYLVLVFTAPSSAILIYLWMIVRVLANVVFVIAIWKWKKWGAYGILAALVIGAIISFRNLPVFIGSIIGLGIIVLILYLLLRKSWKYMD